MKEIIEIKRKEFTVLEQIGEHSFKVERKGKIFFLKKYQDKESFNAFVNNQQRLPRLIHLNYIYSTRIK